MMVIKKSRDSFLIPTSDHGGHISGYCFLCGRHGWLDKIEHASECPLTDPKVVYLEIRSIISDDTRLLKPIPLTSAKSSRADFVIERSSYGWFYIGSPHGYLWKDATLNCGTGYNGVDGICAGLTPEQMEKAHEEAPGYWKTRAQAEQFLDEWLADETSRKRT